MYSSCSLIARNSTVRLANKRKSYTKYPFKINFIPSDSCFKIDRMLSKNVKKLT